MARKNIVKTDNSGEIHFDSRTKAVMAEVSHSQDNIKEKVNAVREVVPGKSNNEIILVLQYYDYNVEKAIQAYLEDGAKSALTEWHFSGPKVASKKKKNKKKKPVVDGDQSPTQNGDVSDHTGDAIPNGVLENGTCAIKQPGVEKDSVAGGGVSESPPAPTPAPVPTPTGIVNGDVSGATSSSHGQVQGPRPTLSTAQDRGAKSTPAVQDRGAKPTPAAQDRGAKPTPATQDRGAKPTPATQDRGAKPTPSAAQDRGAKPTPSAAQDRGAKPTPSAAQDRGAKPTPSAAQDRGARSSPSPAQDQGAKPQPQRAPHQNHRQRLHSGSLSNNIRQRTASERSTTSNAASDIRPVKRKVHGGMERSMKDLHRQTVSLERLRLVMNEEVDKNFKRIKSVFEEVRSSLNKREADLLLEMDRVKAVANNTFASRQKMAADLKVLVDRSETMNDEELSKLRADIKHFIGDRKIDEELSRTTRFLYDSDFLKMEVGRFGEVIPVKTVYSTHPTAAARDVDATPVVTPRVEPTRIDTPRIDPPRSDPPQAESTVSHQTSEQVAKPARHEEPLNRDEAHDVAELQKRLKGSMKLQGIDTSPTPSTTRPSTAPVSSQSDHSSQAPRGSNDQRRNRRRRPPYEGSRGGYSGGYRGGYNGENNRRPNEYYNRSPQEASGDNTVHIGRQVQSGGRGGRGGPRGRGWPRGPRRDRPGGPRYSNNYTDRGPQSNRAESSPKPSVQNDTNSSAA